MKGRGFLAATILVLAMSLASALSVSDYGNFSIQSIFADASLIVSLAAFMVFFPFLYFTLSKFFKDNKMVPTVMSMGLSIFIIWGLNQTIDFSSITLNFINIQLGISNDTLYYLVPILVLLGMIFVSQIKIGKAPNKRKIGFGRVLMVVGLLLILATLTNLIYEKGAAAVLGAVLLVIGFFAWRSSKKKDKLKNSVWGSRNPKRGSNPYANYYSPSSGNKKEKQKNGGFSGPIKNWKKSDWSATALKEKSAERLKKDELRAERKNERKLKREARRAEYKRIDRQNKDLRNERKIETRETAAGDKTLRNQRAQEREIQKQNKQMWKAREQEQKREREAQGILADYNSVKDKFDSLRGKVYKGEIAFDNRTQREMRKLEMEANQLTRKYNKLLGRPTEGSNVGDYMSTQAQNIAAQTKNIANTYKQAVKDQNQQAQARQQQEWEAHLNQEREKRVEENIERQQRNQIQMQQRTIKAQQKQNQRNMLNRGANPNRGYRPGK